MGRDWRAPAAVPGWSLGACRRRRPLAAFLHGESRTAAEDVSMIVFLEIGDRFVSLADVVHVELRESGGAVLTMRDGSQLAVLPDEVPDLLPQLRRWTPGTAEYASEWSNDD